MDEEIVKKEGMSINKIFVRTGEDYISKTVRSDLLIGL